MRHFFVVNPRSFSKPGSLKRALEDIENCFAGKSGAERKTYMSRYPRDAIVAINRYMTGIPPGETVRVYAVGGDGILFDCLNGMADFPNAELTNVPYGRTNDFIRSFGEDARERFRDIKKLAAGPPHPMDIINCGPNYAINEVAFGLESQAVINANNLFRWFRFKWAGRCAPLVYSIGAIGSAMNSEIRRQRYRVLLDGEDLSGRYANISVSNSPCIGGRMFSCPSAKPDDGLLDAIFAAASGSMAHAAKCAIDYGRGHFEKNASFFHRQFQKMEIRSDIPIRIHMDGETLHAEEARLRIMPGHIKFFAPEGMGFADYSHKAHRKGKAAADGKKPK